MKEWKWNKYIVLGLLVAEIIVGGVYCLSYNKREIVELNFTQDDLIYDSGESGFYLDESYNNKYVTTPEFTLPKGLYTLHAEYEYAGKIRLSIIHPDSLYDGNIGGDIEAFDSGDFICDFKVKYSDRPVQIRGMLPQDALEGDYLLIRSIDIQPASSEFRNYLFKIVMFFLLVDIIILLYFWRDKFCFHKEEKIYFKFLFLLIIFTSIPLMTNYLYNPLDMKFHLLRIEGIKNGLLDGMFPVKIQSGWLNNHGYAASVFYGDFFLYIPAILRIFGVSMQAAYKCYVLFINTITVLITYRCFSKMSNAKAGLICTVVYSLNLFRLHNLYSMVAVGEYTAITFMPLLLYGLWKVYTLPEESKEHKRSWITIASGCSGIFLSHMISTEMTALFVILLAIILWKKTLRRKTLIVLLKAVAATVCLNLWFLIPFLDYMLTGTYVINNPDGFRPYVLESRGIFPAQFFMLDYNVIGGSSRSYGEIAGSTPLTVGCAEIAVLVIWFLFCLGKKERDKAEKKEEALAVCFAVLSLFMTTYLFPYTWLAEKFPILQMPERSLEYPWRFYVVTGIVLTYLLCVIMKKSWIEEKKRKLLAGFLVCLSLWQSLAYMSATLKENSSYRIYQGGITSLKLYGEEYLPIDWEKGYDEQYLSAYVDQLTYDTDAVSIADWHREKGSVVVSLTNNMENSCQIEVPLLLYKGYHAVADNGEELVISPGESYRISVSVPAGFSGSFRVAFKEPWYWRVCEMISLLTLIGVISHVIYDRKRQQTVVIKNTSKIEKCG